ncbi:hypothetical protein [Nocardiopsis composta]|uniref:Uncharacterized protein n=1 Tax=Nocardiopsis composta TaxID=157465 RepID=A0A7W8VCV8_9ACTN|nr:hypothetical protein [Nocardiopsis composta]MBB5431348.1 hypothetical protein [Nocardiopsis composta]
MADPELAREVRVERHGDGEARLLVDGEPFPWEIDPGGVRVVTAAGYTPGVTITIPAETVAVVDSMRPPEDEQRKAEIAAYLDSKAPPTSWRPGR